MSSQVSNLFSPKLPCTRLQSVIEMMFVSCMCLFFLPLVPGPWRGSIREHHQAQGGYVTYVGRNSTGSTIHQKGGSWKNQQPAKAPPPPQRKSARFLSITEQRNVMWTFLKDIRSFHDFQNIHTRNIWILMLYSFSHMLVEYELFRKTWADF